VIPIVKVFYISKRQNFAQSDDQVTLQITIANAETRAPASLEPFGYLHMYVVAFKKDENRYILTYVVKG
jgi:hypothetical protein